MQINPLSPEYAVTGQLQATDISKAAQLGYRTIINNRPDYEAADQPLSSHLAVIANEAGLAYHHLPVTPGEMNSEHISRLAALLESAPRPILAFCRTGTRSMMLWQQSGQAAEPAIPGDQARC
ncbi:MAG: TIGR01244 family sulfur transferase [Pseudomonadota bacterium]